MTVEGMEGVRLVESMCARLLVQGLRRYPGVARPLFVRWAR